MPEELIRMIEWQILNEESAPISVCGAAGSGKTHLLLSAARYFAEASPKSPKQTVLYQPYNFALEALKKLLDKSGFELYQNKLKSLEDADILFIDDINSAAISDTQVLKARADFLIAVKERLSEKKPVIFARTVSPEDMRSTWLRDEILLSTLKLSLRTHDISVFILHPLSREQKMSVLLHKIALKNMWLSVSQVRLLKYIAEYRIPFGYELAGMMKLFREYSKDFSREIDEEMIEKYFGSVYKETLVNDKKPDE